MPGRHIALLTVEEESDAPSILSTRTLSKLNPSSPVKFESPFAYVLQLPFGRQPEQVLLIRSRLSGLDPCQWSGSIDIRTQISTDEGASAMEVRSTRGSLVYWESMQWSPLRQAQLGLCRHQQDVGGPLRRWRNSSVR